MVVTEMAHLLYLAGSGFFYFYFFIFLKGYLQNMSCEKCFLWHELVSCTKKGQKNNWTYDSDTYAYQCC